MASKYSAFRRRSHGSFVSSLLCLLVVIASLFYGYNVFYDYTRDEFTFPVSRVEVYGDLKYLTKAEIASTVGLVAGNKNLVSLDLASVHNALVQMPWVAQASVIKKFPDTIVVNIKEHIASARWKSTGLYDAQSNSVFYPDPKDLYLPLVVLRAPHDSLAGDLYNHASNFMKLLQDSPYLMEEVQLDTARGYRIRLKGDVWLILGRESKPDLPYIRLKRFLVAFHRTKLKLSDIEYVDLRYDNGFAVGERQNAPAASESKVEQSNKAK